ncbi:hypothetical protein [Flavobacterium sp.]|uniref:hypothetical protein n=1 Tax=Flavobacterium sp. TaxID=239 RepID=UPI0025D44D10|nr:hypothetical protein [Flavobacterium sp.]
MTFEIIKNWIIENKDSLIVELVMFCFFWLSGKMFLIGRKLPELIKKSSKYKIVKYFEFGLLYILPIVFILISINDDTTKLSYKNICIFIVICVTFIFNILMNKIIGIYDMIKQLTNISSNKLKMIDEEFAVVHQRIENLKNN